MLLLSEGQMSDYKGAALTLHALPPAKQLIADRGYDSDCYRLALRAKGIEPCIPGRKNQKLQLAHDGKLYRQRHRIENMLAKLKDWRRVATRYDRCAHTSMSAIVIAATMLFWINES